MSRSARDRSVVLRILNAVGERLRTAVGRSAFVRLLPTGVSRPERRGELFVSLDRAITNSTPSAAIGTASTGASRMRRVAGASRLASTCATLGRYVAASSLYRGLSPRSDRGAIVIDLRETRSVGPVIRAAGRTTRRFATGISSSNVGRTAIDLERLVRKQPVRAASVFVLSAAISAVLLTVLFGGSIGAVRLGHLLAIALAAIGLRSRDRGGKLRETRFAGSVSAAFEPPESPEPVEDESDRSEADAEPLRRSGLR